MKYISETEEKFDSIYRSYSDDVYKVCLYYSRDYDVAEDLTQQTFMKFYHHIDSVEMENVRAYLVRTARNLYCNYYRDTKRRAEIESTLENQSEMVVESPEEMYFRKVHKEDEAQLSNKILGDLHEKHENWYELFNGMYMENKSGEEMSAELGVSEDVIYSRIYRAKRWVRKRYEKMFKDISDMA